MENEQRRFSKQVTEIGEELGHSIVEGVKSNYSSLVLFFSLALGIFLVIADAMDEGEEKTDKDE